MSNTPKLNSKKTFERQGKIFAYSMVLFAVVHFIIFFIYLNFEQFRMAFCFEKADGSEEYSFRNFIEIFESFKLPKEQSAAQFALINTVLYWIVGAVKLIITVFVSYFIWKKVPGHGIFMFIFFLPSIIPSVMYITSFKSLLSTGGILSSWSLEIFGQRFPEMITHNTITNTMLWFTLWGGFGVNMLIYVGAFGRIPDSVIDAAKIDGCGWVRELWSITIPLIWETLSVMLILNVSTIFTATGPILLFLGEGNMHVIQSYTITYWIYALVYKKDLYFASAISILFTVLAIPLVVITRIIVSKMNKEVTY